MSASAFRLSSVGETVRLSWRTNDGNNGLFPQAVIVSDAGVLVSTTNLSVISVAGVAGAYEASYTPTTEGEFNIYYSVYSSSDNRDAQTPVSELYEGNTEVLKVRSFPVFSGVASSLGGFTEDDLKDLTKAFKKINFWKQKLSSGKTAEEELLAKSEFNPDIQIVKTDIEIPETDFSTLESKINSIASLMPTIKTDLTKEIKSIKEWFPTVSLDKFPEVLNGLSSLNLVVSSIPKLIEGINNISQIKKLEDILVSQGQTLSSLSQSAQDQTKVDELQVSLNNALEILKSVATINSLSSLENTVSSLSKELDAFQTNMSEVSKADKAEVDNLVNQLNQVLKGISSDIQNIKEKEGILGAIKQLI